VRLEAAIRSGRWFCHRAWLQQPLEPHAFRFVGGRWEKALRTDLGDTKRTERRFSPEEVLSDAWVLEDAWNARQGKEAR
jgi:hypothetical protein